MSAATEFPPIVRIPERARRTQSAPRPRPDSTPGFVPGPGVEGATRCQPRRPERLASVTTLHRPEPRTVASPVRLTRRGVVVVGAGVAVLAAALLGVARLSAPVAAGAGAPAAHGPATVAVRAGDTLWSIAGRVAPSRDPRAEVADLQRLNHLASTRLVPGQVLRTR